MSPTSSVPTTPSTSSSLAPPKKAITQNPPPLRADASFQDFHKTIEEVLDVLQAHVKCLRNKAHCRRELLSCEQLEGETFSDFYVRLKHVTEEVEICPGNSSICEETQLKIIILMGIKDEELMQKLFSLKATASLQEVVNTCCSYEAARKATSAIRSPPSKLSAISSYKKQKGHAKTYASAPASKSVVPCESCAHTHSSSDKCPAADSNCTNCGY
ncbi:uncharacterized protein LOC135226620 [Macrobrachium nipponense]|uniref:uncharacterized protein LOC135226620 n=1 Tax=Macrobrachium nipponense TaxID=159736 RepID=UPI0030C879BC